MRGRRGWGAACVAVVLAAHAALLAAFLRAPASGVRRAPPHRTAAVRLVVLGQIAEPQAADPAEPRSPSADGAASPISAPAPRSSVPAATPEPLAMAARAALAPAEAAATTPSPQVSTVAPTRDFLSPTLVDRIAIAFPSPDITSLSGLSWSGVPMRLRLFVDATGRCVDVKFLRANEDANTLEHLRQMFLATHFIPARRGGADVDSYRDIELDVSDVK